MVLQDEFIGQRHSFPQRNLIIFLTFSVILVTLVFQGLTLPPLIRVLGSCARFWAAAALSRHF
jgi:NhaP-type Na+/H+ or K+/H+ antiporter